MTDPTRYPDELQERFGVSLSMTERIRIAGLLTRWMPDQGPAERDDVMIEAIRETGRFQGIERLLDKSKGIACHRFGKPKSDPFAQMDAKRAEEREERLSRHFGDPGDWSTMTREGWVEGGFFSRQFLAERFPEVADRLAQATGIEVPDFPRDLEGIADELRREKLRAQAETILEGES